MDNCIDTINSNWEELKPQLDLIIQERASITGSIHTAQIISGLMNQWPKPISGEQARSFHHLCHKVHVSKRVLVSYAVNWKKTGESENISLQELSALINLFAAYAAIEVPSQAGIALKSLNAALAAFDLAINFYGDFPLRNNFNVLLDELLQYRFNEAAV